MESVKNKLVRIIGVLYLVVFFVNSTCAQNANQTFTLIGHILNCDTLKSISLINTETRATSQASVDKNGLFHITGHLNHASVGLIEGNNLSSGSGVWLTKDSVRAEFLILKDNTNKYYIETVNVVGNEESIDFLKIPKYLHNSLLKKDNQFVIDYLSKYVEAHTHSYLSLYMISTYIYQIGATHAKELLSNLSPLVRNTNEALFLKERIKNMEAVIIGRKMPEFSLPDMNNKNINVKAVLKPFTILNFWASWCEPCIKHTIDLQNLQNNSDKNKFNIIGISLDKNKKSWIAAIEKYNLSWMQLSDLKGFDGELINKVSLSGIPYIILVDDKLTILATTLYDIQQVLKEKGVSTN